MLNAMVLAEIWLQDTLGKPLGIDDLADHLGYSTSQVRRQFSRHFGSSPGAYRDRRRLERAAVLLALGADNIARIGLSCGYRNHPAFSRAFQRLYGKTPRSYRIHARRTLSRRTGSCTLPQCGMAPRIEHKSARHVMLRRFYQARDQASLVRLQQEELVRLDGRYRHAVPGMALPDLLSRHIGACSGLQPSQRIDIGFYLPEESEAERLPLPAPYRRLYQPARPFAVLSLADIKELDDAVSCLVHYLLRHPAFFRLSGEAPYILWRGSGLELHVPLAQPCDGRPPR